MRCRVILVFLTVTLLLVLTPGSRALAQSSDTSAIESALAHLDPMLGSWSGSGFLRFTPEGDKLPYDCTWTIARSHAGRFLRLEFMATTGETTINWAGYFTYNQYKGLYTTLWKSLDSNYEFHETGSFDADTRTLTLTSFQDHGPGKEHVEVRSVFTIDGPDTFHVIDTTKDTDTSEWFESFSFTLERAAP